MTSALDATLDDLIKQNKRQKKSGGADSRERTGPGPVRRSFKRSGRRSAPYSAGKTARAPETQWQHDLYREPGEVYPEQRGKKASAIETGTKIYISNLDYGVSNDDIKDLFSEVGDLKRFSVHYDRSGRSKGTAEVVFARRADAATAVAKYNNVQLDGKPMKIEIVGTNISSSSQPSNPLPKREPARDNAGGASRSGRRRRGRGGRKSGNERRDPLSTADLDADLEKYHSESMQIN